MPGTLKLNSGGAGNLILTPSGSVGSDVTVTVPAGTGTVAVQGQSTNIVSGTAVASTSGTSIDFTGIPSWVRRITVMFKGVSGNGTSDLLLQIGSGSVTTSGYTSASWGNGNSLQTSTAGFRLTNANNASYLNDGTAILTLLDSATYKWTCMDNISASAGGVYYTGAGAGSLSGVLDRIRITTINGTDTFDAGSINILYE